MFRRPPVPLRNGRLRSAGGQLLGESFDPLDVGWEHAYWTEGSEFLAEGYSDTDAVSSWPDEVGTADLAQATGTNQPTYGATAGPNSQPVVTSDSVNDSMVTATSAISSFGSTWSIVLIGSFDDSPNNNYSYFCDTQARQFMGVQRTGDTPGDAWRLYDGSTAFTAGTYDNQDHLFVAIGSGTNDQMLIDGSVIIDDTGGVVAFPGTSFTLFSKHGGSDTQASSWAFVGLFDGDVTTDPNWASFLDWVEQHYGITEFDPVNDVSWSHAYWTEGTEFTALGLSDTDAVSSWPDEASDQDLAQATGSAQPTLDATDADLNNQPTIVFDGTDDVLSKALDSQVADPYTVVAIVSHRTPATDSAVGFYSTSFGALIRLSGSTWRIGSSSNNAVSAGTDDVAMLRGLVNGASSEMSVNNGATGSVTGTFNSHANRIDAGNRQSALPFDGSIAFIGVFDGDVTTDPGWASFKTWVTSHYGIVLA